MQVEQVALRRFVDLHGSKYKNIKCPERAVFLARFSDVMSLDVKPTKYRQSDIVQTFDTDDATVRFLLRQLQTYDMDTQNVLGLVFSGGTVLAHVIQCGQLREES